MSEKVKSYFTFGQEHKHLLNDTVLDKDTVLLIHAKSHDQARYLMLYLFGNKWAFQYEDDPPNMEYFSEIVEIDVSIRIARVSK